jgi:hypothetical protein
MNPLRGDNAFRPTIFDFFAGKMLAIGWYRSESP